MMPLQLNCPPIETLPTLQVSVEQGDGRYKVFRGLPASPAMPFDAATSSAGDDSGSGNGSGGAGVQLHLLQPSGAGGFRHPGGMFLAPDPTSSDGMACGMLAMGQQAWDGLQSAEECQALLARQFPALPPKWLPEVRPWICHGGSAQWEAGGACCCG